MGRGTEFTPHATSPTHRWRTVENVSGAPCPVRRTPSFRAAPLVDARIAACARVRIRQLVAVSVLGEEILFMKLLDKPGWIADREPASISKAAFVEVSAEQIAHERDREREWRTPKGWREQQRERAVRAPKDLRPTVAHPPEEISFRRTRGACAPLQPRLDPAALAQQRAEGAALAQRLHLRELVRERRARHFGAIERAEAARAEARGQALAESERQAREAAWAEEQAYARAEAESTAAHEARLQRDRDAARAVAEAEEAQRAAAEAQRARAAAEELRVQREADSAAARAAAAKAARRTAAAAAAREGQVPRGGIALDDLEELTSLARVGRRIFRRDDGGAGFYQIAAQRGVPHDCRRSGTPPAPWHGVTAVINHYKALPVGAREIPAAVWDNVVVRAGAEKGRVGKVVEFRPGARGDGSDDVYVVESLAGAQFDACLCAAPTLGWSADGWPANYASATAKHQVELELGAADFERYTEYLTVHDAVQLVVAPDCAQSGGSFCDALEERGGATTAPATVFVSYAAKHDATAVARALRAWSDSAPPAEPPHRFWLRATSLSQHDIVTGALPTNSPPWLASFEAMLAQIGLTLPVLMPWRAPLSVGTVRCVFELYESIRAGAEVAFVLPPRARAEMDGAIATEFSSVADAIASGVALDGARHVSRERRGIAAEMARREETVEAVNAAARGALRGWLERAGRAELVRRGEDAMDRGTLKLATSVGRLLKRQEKYDEAELLYRRALAGHEAAHGKLHKETLKAVSRLGALLLECARPADAEALFRRAVIGREATLGAAHTRTLSSVANLGEALRAQGKTEAAVPFIRRALAGREQLHGPVHADTLEAVSQLGAVLEEEGEFDEAEALMRRALEVHERVHGPNEDRTLSAMSSLALLLKVRGKMHEAEPLFRRTLEGRERTLGKMHPTTLLAVVSFGRVLHAQQKDAEAESYMERAVQGQSLALGHSHPQTLHAVMHFGRMLHTNARHADAQPHFDRAAEGRRAVLGAQHPDTKEAKHWQRLNLVVLSGGAGEGGVDGSVGSGVRPTAAELAPAMDAPALLQCPPKERAVPDAHE